MVLAEPYSPRHSPPLSPFIGGESSGILVFQAVCLHFNVKLFPTSIRLSFSDQYFYSYSFKLLLGSTELTGTLSLLFLNFFFPSFLPSFLPSLSHSSNCSFHKYLPSAAGLGPSTSGELGKLPAATEGNIPGSGDRADRRTRHLGRWRDAVELREEECVSVSLTAGKLAPPPQPYVPTSGSAALLGSHGIAAPGSPQLDWTL